MAKKKGKGMSIGDILQDEVNEDSAIHAQGDALCKITDLSVGETREARKKKFLAQLTIEQPKEYAGSMLFDHLVIGSDDDPDAEEQRTWKKAFGAKRLRKMLRCSGVDMAGMDEEEICEAAKEQTVGVIFHTEVQADGDFKGQIRNSVTGYFEPGEREPEMEEFTDGKTKKKGTPAKAAPKKRPPSEEEEEEEEEKPKAKVKAKAKSKDDDDDDDEEEEEEAEEEDDDEDEEEDDEDERPKGKRR